MKRGKITAPADLSGSPDWAKPIIAAAILLHKDREADAAARDPL